MSDLKTKPTDQSVETFIHMIDDEQKRQDAFTLVQMMRAATGAEPRMWGDAIIGFGKYRYTYASGRSGEWFLTGFSPRKQNLTLYIMPGFDQYDDLLGSLGKYKTGKSCLYIKRLSDINMAALQQLVQQSVEHMIKTNA